MAHTDSQYNGWTNYATWRVNLEVFDGYDPSDYFQHSYADDVQGLTRNLADSLRDMAEDLLHETSKEGIARDYALAFLGDVNWDEIAATIESDWRSASEITRALDAIERADKRISDITERPTMPNV